MSQNFPSDRLPRLLIVRYDGHPFDIRMARVVGTILESGWRCDLLVPQNGIGTADPAKETSKKLLSEVGLWEFPVAETRLGKINQQFYGAGYFGSYKFKRYLTTLLGERRYNAILVRDSLCLPRVFQSLTSAKQRNLPVICEIYEPRVEQVYDSLIRFGNWRRRLSAYARLLMPRLRSAQKRYLPLCDHIFVVVEEMKSFLIDDYKLDPSRVSVVHNVEILEEFDQIKKSEISGEDGRVLVSYVGTFGPHRGIELLIDAVGLVSSRPHAPFRLAIVGAFGKELRRLEGLCRSRGVEKLVKLIEWVPHRAAMQWIKGSDIGVIPHLDTIGIRTTIPFKLFQYMASGAACIVSDVGPLGRIVHEEGCGLAFRAGSAADLANKLRFLLEHPDQRSTMGARGRISSEQKYRWEIEAQHYSRYLASLL